MVTLNISLPEDMRRRIDLLVREGGYSSSSEVVRDALRSFLVEREFMSKLSGTILGVIATIYDTGRRGISDELTHLQHSFSDVVLATTHGHMGSSCLEAILVRGDVNRVKELVERTKSVRGTEVVKAVVLSA